MSKKIVVTFFGVVFCCIGLGVWFVVSEIYTAVSQDSAEIRFVIEPGESVREIATRLEEEGVIRSAPIFLRYVSLKDVDRKIHAGDFVVTKPITLARVVEALAKPSVSERTITILPGWGIREIAAYLQEEGIGTQEEVYALAGRPAVQYSGVGDTLGISDMYEVLQDKPQGISYEGYFRPDTYRIFTDATVEEVLERLVKERNVQFTEQMYQDIKKSGRTVHQVMTVASIVEKEVRSSEDRKIVADLFWRRYDENWALQADSTVHYIVGKDGSVFTTQADRETDNPWNTYKYAGLPPGPISNPSLDSILATIYPTPNKYNYFLTTLDTGEVKYAQTLDQHNLNRSRYLQ